MKNRVRIGTCSGPAEAAFVRSVFDAHGLPVVINGEMHAGALGGLGGFVRLDILVAGEDAEEARELLRDIRAGDHALAEGAEPVAEADGDAHADAHGVWDAAPVSAEPSARAEATPVPPVFAPTTGYDTRRRRTGVALLLTVMPGFGTAHMSTGAWGRGIALALINAAGIGMLASDVRVAGWILFGARLADMFGALWRIWTSPPTEGGR